MKMEALFTREKANEGTKVPLSYADGTPTDHHLVIRSQWSDAFQQAKQDAYRQDMEALAKGEAVDSTERHVTLCAALVAGWDLEEEFTEENVKTLLREAPQLRDMIDRHASRDARFFRKPSTDSTSGRKKK